MPNNFNPGDVVYYPAKTRTHGIVLATLCGECSYCRAKEYVYCIKQEKPKVLVQWMSAAGEKTKARYHFSELVLDKPAATPRPKKTINGSKPWKPFMVDIKKLGIVELDISPIDDEEVLPRSEKEEQPPATSGPRVLTDEEDEYSQYAEYNRWMGGGV